MEACAGHISRAGSGWQHRSWRAENNFIQIADVVTRSSRAKRCRAKRQPHRRRAIDPGAGEIWECMPAASTPPNVPLPPRGLCGAIDNNARFPGESRGPYVGGTSGEWMGPGLRQEDAGTRCRGKSSEYLEALKRLLERGLVGLAFWRGHLADEIGDRRAEGKLGPVGILEPELVIVDDPGTM